MADTLPSADPDHQQPPTPSFAPSSSFSLLLSLPRELRDRIYYYALVSAVPFWWPHPAPLKHNVSPSLLAVSRQVYEEAAPILYAANKFLFTHPSDCTMFRVVASPQHSALLSAVYLRIREKDLRLWTAYLGSRKADRSFKHDLPRLQTLWIFLKCGNVGTPAMMGHLGQLGPIAGLPPQVAAQVHAVQHALGQQIQALHHQLQTLSHTLTPTPAHHVDYHAQSAQGQAHFLPPPPPPPAPQIGRAHV